MTSFIPCRIGRLNTLILAIVWHVQVERIHQRHCWNHAITLKDNNGWWSHISNGKLNHTSHVTHTHKHLRIKIEAENVYIDKRQHKCEFLLYYYISNQEPTLDPEYFTRSTLYINPYTHHNHNHDSWIMIDTHIYRLPTYFVKILH